MKVEYLESGEKPAREYLRRLGTVGGDVAEEVATIIAEVRERGDVALAEFTERFDGAKKNSFYVAPDAIARAVKAADRQVIAALEKAARNIWDFHENQKQKSWFLTREDGALIGSRLTPIDSVGVYVPGGRAQYPSTVLMDVIPARVAGVRRIVIVTPPRPDGSLSPELLAAAQIAGATEVYAVGGAQAIAALTYGTEQIAAVDKIVGPGNSYVAAAKRLVSGDVGIDMVAGPSEVLILADETADPAFVAIDLLAQAEHDPEAATFLVTTDEELVDEVIERIEAYLARSPRLEVTKESIDKCCTVFVCPDLATALLAANSIAPEHLEIQMDQPLELLGLIENAGSIFLGPWTPESVGDYVAGPNHTLPTGGTARFSSPLSVDDFTKRSSVISYSFAALEADAATIQTIAACEGLWAHAQAVELRLNPETDGED
ncbi:MAG: histidinol dehydrogenase [Coriobacteriales bacterium]|jgi:histidinol dehydrogenase|nr:histidinol dehydrogenase [Coriobacteriales bacterium]